MRRRGRVACLTVLVAGGLAGCPALDGLPAGDGGPDADAKASTADVDASELDEAIDSQETATSTDGDAAACTVIDAAPDGPPVSADASCALSDGSTCAPAPLAAAYQGYLTMPPPRANVAQCTNTQISAYLTACPNPLDLLSGNCPMFTNDAANAACLSCLSATPVTMSPAGPIVYSPFPGATAWTYNFAGCVQVLEPCNASCAQALWASPQCLDVACLPVCMGAAASGIPACEQDAVSCLCASRVQAATACYDAIQAAKGPAAGCFGSAGVLAAFCGGA
jgi:hypothetical protein